MTGQLIGTIILWLIVAVIIVVVVVWLLSWLYQRSTKDMSFVRTGFGGEKVVINGGALVLPIIHEITPVDMKVNRIKVVREKENALVTRDKVRVDIDADFYVRVSPSFDGVSAAATTLGKRMGSDEGLDDLLQGKFVSVLRAVASELTLDEIHEKRGEFMQRVSEHTYSLLEPNGLHLESAAITDLDQTDLEYFNPANRFDAEGLTSLITTIEERRKLRNDIEQTASLEIRERNLQAEQESLSIERQITSAKLNQEKEIEELRASQRAEVARVQASHEANAAAARITSEQETTAREIARNQAVEQAEINAREEIEQQRIEHERRMEHARIERETSVRSKEIAEKAAIEAEQLKNEHEVQASRIAAEEATAALDIERQQKIEAANIASRQEIESAQIAKELQIEKASIEREKALRTLRIEEQRVIAESEIISREEVERARIASDRSLEEARILLERDTKRLEVERAQALELAEIEKDIQLLRKQAEQSSQRVETFEADALATVAQEAVETGRETEVAKRLAAVDRLIAEKDADMARVAIETDKLRAAVAAEAERLMIEAENTLSEDARSSRLRGKMLERLEGIIRESVKPLENIDGIKIVQMAGVGGEGGDKNAVRSPTDEVIDSALRFRAQAPLIDEMMREIGVPDAGVAKMGDVFRSAKDAASLANTNASADKNKKDD